MYGFDAVADLAPFLASTAEAHGTAYHSNMTTNGYSHSRRAALFQWKIDNYQITLMALARFTIASPTRDESPFSRIFENLVSCGSVWTISMSRSA